MKYKDNVLTSVTVLAVTIFPVTSISTTSSKYAMLKSTDAAIVRIPDGDSHINRLLAVGPVPDHFTPHPPPLNWIGLGDSYTASPGTGADYDSDKQCRRNAGSYVIQLKKDFPFKEANNMDFIACSGYTAPDVLTKTIPTIKQNEADFMVMTLGGNDIGFAKIAIDCLISPGIFFPQRCEETLSQAQRQILDVQLQNNIHSVYDSIFAKMKDDYHYQLYHIFYSRFFDDTTAWCDDVTFSGAITGPRLKQFRRQRINKLTDVLNNRLEEIAANYIKLRRGRPSWDNGSRLITINPDRIPNADGAGTYGLFDGHRFCEPGATELETDNVWFFGSLDHDSKVIGPTGRTSMISERDVAGDLEVRASNGSNPNPLPPTPEFLVQSFHPKTAGMQAIEQQLRLELQRHRKAENRGNEGSNQIS